MTDTPASTVETTIHEHRTAFTIFAILMVILGVVAIAFPFLTTIAAKIFLGWLFIIGGVMQIIHAFSTPRWSAFLLDLLIGILYLVVGGWLAFFPLTGILTLTVVLAVLFIVEGVLEFGMAMRLRNHSGWFWILLSGIVAVVIGVLIIAELPSSAAWAIGLLVGINLIASGLSYLFLTMSAPRTA